MPHPSSEDAALRSETVARLIRAGFSQADAREEAERIVVWSRRQRKQRSKR